jgi:hypothetical protein
MYRAPVSGLEPGTRIMTDDDRTGTVLACPPNANPGVTHVRFDPTQGWPDGYTAELDRQTMVWAY